MNHPWNNPVDREHVLNWSPIIRLTCNNRRQVLWRTLSFSFPSLADESKFVGSHVQDSRKHHSVGLEDCLNLIKRKMVLNHDSQKLKNRFILEMAIPMLSLVLDWITIMAPLSEATLALENWSSLPVLGLGKQIAGRPASMTS